MQQGGEASTEMSFPVFLTESGTLVYNITANPLSKVFPLSSRGPNMKKAEIHLLLQNSWIFIGTDLRPERHKQEETKREVHHLSKSVAQSRGKCNVAGS